MNYESRDTYGIYKTNPIQHEAIGPGPRLMGADTLIGNDVYNRLEEDLGEVKEIMLDVASGRVAYAVLSFGSFLGFGEKLFAVPWQALQLDTINKRFILDIDKSKLENAPGFDKHDWPDMADETWARKIHGYYGSQYRDLNINN